MKQAGDFWSRRKQAVEAEAEAEVAELVAVEEQQTAEEQDAKSDEQILEELGLQDPDTLQDGDDFSAFMAKAVPTRLRNRALRKLWLSNPALANLDALLDYGEDFTKSERALEDFQTTYQVGKGLLAHVKEMARQEEAKLTAQDEADEAPEATEEEVTEELEEHAPSKVLALAEEEDAQVDAEEPAEPSDEDDFEADIAFAPKKRMRFVIEADI